MAGNGVVLSNFKALEVEQQNEGANKKNSATEYDLEMAGNTNESDYDKPTEEFDPWALPELQDKGPKWKEMTTKEKFARVLINFIKICLLIGLLYMFICSLDFLSNAFRLLGGKAAGEAFAEEKILKNPVAGLMIGLLATVLVQSSSTSTSIIVSMVGAGIIEVRPAIPMVMGANIGTSVTNTIVSLAQAIERNEFRRAFAGATVHDVFNWLSVILLLPLEAASHYLFHLSDALINAMNLKESQATKKDLLKVITKPFTSLIIQVDKNIIKNIALQKKEYESRSLIKTSCGKGFNTTSNETIPLPCEFLFYNTGLSDTTIGIILLIIALVILCLCLIFIVKLLHSLLKGYIAKTIKKTMNSDFPKPFHHLTGYFTILVGAGLTILVQSSSIFTSALTPLIGIGVVTLERAYPLTLGANIGTTATGILAALASDGSSLGRSLQIALCHLFFNITGILIWYPIPIMRRVPIRVAKVLGNTTAKYRWFAVAYLIVVFLLLPAAIFGLSVAGWEVLVGVGVPILLLLIIIIVINIMQSKAPNSLPVALRTWKWAPKALRSLEPYDKVFAKGYGACKGRFKKVANKSSK